MRADETNTEAAVLHRSRSTIVPVERPISFPVKRRRTSRAQRNANICMLRAACGDCIDEPQWQRLTLSKIEMREGCAVLTKPRADAAEYFRA